MTLLEASLILPKLMLLNLIKNKFSVLEVQVFGNKISKVRKLPQGKINLFQVGWKFKLRFKLSVTVMQVQ